MCSLPLMTCRSMVDKNTIEILKSFAILFKPASDLNVFMLKSPRR